jgi:hypothetical protein
MSKFSLTRTATINARTTGSIKATASVDHRLDTGELITDEQISVFRAPGETDFEVGPYFTTRLTAAPEGYRTIVQVFADDQPIGSLVRLDNGNWIARSENGADVTRPTTAESAWDALTHLFIASESSRAELIDEAAAERQSRIDGLVQEQQEALLAAEQAVLRAHKASARLRDGVKVDNHHFLDTFNLRHQLNDLLRVIGDEQA